MIYFSIAKICGIIRGSGRIIQAQQMYLAIPDNKKNAKVYFLLGVTTLEKDRDQAQKYFAQAKQMDAKYYQQAMNQYASIMKMLNDKEKKNYE